MRAGATGAERRRRGVVLFIVLFFALLLSSTIATFARRSTVDAIISRNRERAARADALARGGVRLAEALLLQDRLLEEAGAADPLDGAGDGWRRWSGQPLPVEVGDDAQLTLEIEDTGSRLNLNALFALDEAGELAPYDETEAFLIAILERTIDKLAIPPGEKALYDPRELAYNLIDWIDSDDVRVRGGPEDDYYQRQDPPYRSPKGPLLSVEELRLIEGFDATLVRGLTPFVSVYPFAPGGCGRDAVGCGINVNTADPWVLFWLYYNDGVDDRLATEDVVRQILRIREDGGVLCAKAESAEACTPMTDIVSNAIFPPPTFRAEIFVVTADARVGEVRRTIEAVVDRSAPADPRLLSWRAR